VLFIGEAPGKNEDQQGKPFVGAAGKFLNEMLEMVDLKRQDVYITNIVKYRPPNNRDPLPDEKAAFLPYLQAQLEVIQPKIVVTLGRHSMNCFLPDLQISKIHGQPKRIRINMHNQAERIKQGETGVSPESSHGVAIVIMPLFHPAAALYNGGMRQTLIDDFAKIPIVLEKINS
jgi:uracil-DNA glycosylase